MAPDASPAAKTAPGTATASILRAADTPSQRVVQVVDGQKVVLAADSLLVYSDVVGDESLRGKLISAGPILECVDMFAACVAENVTPTPAYRIATLSVDRVDIKGPIMHGDMLHLEGEVISIGRTSIVTEARGYREDIKSGKYVEVLRAFVTMVAIDPKTLRPWAGLPKLVNPADPSYVTERHALANRRKELSIRWRAVQEEVDQLLHVSADMIKCYGHQHDELVAVPETVFALRNSFMPKHLNRNDTVFGGDVMTFMDKAALQCAKRFTGNTNMVAVSMNRVLFKRPISIAHMITVVARVCSVRRHQLEVEVDVFISPPRTKSRLKSHSGYFMVANLDEKMQKKRITKGLLVDEADQASMRTMLKAQHRMEFDEKERELLSQEPLAWAAPTSKCMQPTVLSSRL